MARRPKIHGLAGYGEHRPMIEDASSFSETPK
jgi:hypothetical protein